MPTTRPRTAVLAGLAGGLLLISACSSSSETATTTSAPGSTASTSTTAGSATSAPASTSTTAPGTVTDPAVPIETTVGSTFFITVESNPTTGYTWNITGNPADSIAVPIGNTPTTSSGSMPGEGGTTTFEFKASGPGTTKITLTYARIFDPTDSPTVNEYTLVVTS